MHIRDPTDLPTAHIAVEGRTCEELGHVGDLGCDPLVHCPIEGGVGEGSVQRGHARGIPLRDVTVEGGRVLEGAVHAGDVTDVPVGHIPVELGGILERLVQTVRIAQIEQIPSRGGQVRSSLEVAPAIPETKRTPPADVGELEAIATAVEAPALNLPRDGDVLGAPGGVFMGDGR